MGCHLFHHLGDGSIANVMPMKATPRFLFLLLTASALLGVTFVTLFRRQNIGTRDPNHDVVMAGGRTGDMFHGDAIMPKLGNETAKAELGRATWKYFHTVMARFPDKPTSKERTMLKEYIYLFQRLYPCGECANHFGHIIKQFPPQVSSRSSAATWACHVHNEVNKSLDKDMFDCSKIGDFYDCGCADDDKEKKKSGSSSTKDNSSKRTTGRNDDNPDG